MTIPVKCSCGKTLRAKDSAAGKKAKCPACGEILQVPDVVEGEEAEADDEWGFGSMDLASMERSAPAVPGEKRRACPMCGESIMATAAKCRHCGEFLDPAVKKREARRERTSSRSYSSDDDGMTGVDWVLCILCPGIACIVGLVRLIQGKSSGGIMIGVSLGMGVVWNVIKLALMSMQAAQH